jgi:hypothetical protein
VGAKTTVRLPAEQRAAVDRYAAQHGLTLAEAVRVLLDVALQAEARHDA